MYSVVHSLIAAPARARCSGCDPLGAGEGTQLGHVQHLVLELRLYVRVLGVCDVWRVCVC